MEILLGMLISNAVPVVPWTYITVDFITKLLQEKKYNEILVVVNRLTKIVYFVVILKIT